MSEQSKTPAAKLYGGDEAPDSAVIKQNCFGRAIHHSQTTEEILHRLRPYH